MLSRADGITLSVDLMTLAVVATFVAALIGLALLVASRHDRMPALAWWGAAYLLGGLAVIAWCVEDLVSPPLPAGFGSAMLFMACGMMWSAARLFHGRPVLWGTMSAGATVWLALSLVPGMMKSSETRATLTFIIIAFYMFVTAAELWRERRRALIRRWPALFVPILHAAVFMFPIPLAALMPGQAGMLSLTSSWIAVIMLEVVLYVVGMAFIVLVLSKDRLLHVRKTAATTDPLTGLFNGRGFYEAAERLASRARPDGATLSVLMCEVDHFKTLSERFGNAVGDAALKLFAATIRSTTRTNDIIARLAGEEFAVVLIGGPVEAKAAAERLRAAFELAAAEIRGSSVGATVSIGVSAGQAGLPFEVLLRQAAAALKRAKAQSHNCVAMFEAPPGIATDAGEAPVRDPTGGARSLVRRRLTTAQTKRAPEGAL
jgi:diguanylate cyclase (GGDEF)-like protein